MQTNHFATICSALLALVFAPTSLAEEMIGDWTLKLESGTPAWMSVMAPKGDSEEPTVRLRLHVGPDGPHRDVKHSEGVLKFTLRQNKKAKDTKTVEARLEDGKLVGTIIATSNDGVVKRDAFTGKKIPPLPSTPPDLSKVRFGHPISLFNGKNLDGWRPHEQDKINGWSVKNGVMVNHDSEDGLQRDGSLCKLAHRGRI